MHLLKETRQLVVKTRNKLVHRFKLATMVQGGDEHIASFETRLKLVARTGRFQVEGLACKKQTDYTDQMVLDNLIRGPRTRRSRGRYWPHLRPNAPLPRY